ncbi:MAG: Ig-like domain-containing protein [Lachnospiraceae bacterium]
MKKKPLLFLTFFCILMFFGICRLDASASETLKEVSYTTQTYNVDEWDTVTITPNLGFTDNLAEDNNKYKVAITITPVYNSVSFSYYDSEFETHPVSITDSQMLKRLNKETNIICLSTYEDLSPVYGDDELVSSFSKTISSVTAEDLNDFDFWVEFPYSDDIESIFTELGEVEDIYDVQYSVKFQVTASVSLESGVSPSVKLNKTSVSGYVNYIFYLTEIVANQQGNYKIVKATSSNSSVASVSSSTGKITLKKTGKCTITVTNAYGKSASFKVTVNPSTISRQRSSISCVLGTKMNLATKGVVLILGTPKYTVKSSKSSVVSVGKSGNQPIIRAKKTGSAVLTFTCGKKKFSIRVKVSKPKIVLASSVTLNKGDSRTVSANKSSNGIYIKKATSTKGRLSVKISSNARSLTLTANKNFSGTSTSDKVVVTFNNGTKKTIKVKINKKFSLKDVKITLKRSYWDGSKACLEYTITNNSSKNLTKVKIYYSGILNEEVNGYFNVNSSIPRGKSKTFTKKLDYFDYLDDAKLKVVSAS